MCWYLKTLLFFGVIILSLSIFEACKLVVKYQTPLPPDGQRQRVKHRHLYIRQAHVCHPLWVGFGIFVIIMIIMKTVIIIIVVHVGMPYQSSKQRRLFSSALSSSSLTG